MSKQIAFSGSDFLGTFLISVIHASKFWVFVSGQHNKNSKKETLFQYFKKEDGRKSFNSIGLSKDLSRELYMSKMVRVSVRVCMCLCVCLLVCLFVRA